MNYTDIPVGVLALLCTIALSVVNVLFGWLMKVLFSQFSDMRKDHADFDKRMQALEIHLPTNYVSKDDFKSAIGEMKVMLEKIYDRLDNKADKT